MPISLLKARRARTADTKSVTVEFGEESMNVEFRLSAITPSTLQALQDADGDKLEVIAGLSSGERVIVSPPAGLASGAMVTTK